MIVIKRYGTEARDPSVIYHNGFYYHCFATDTVYVSKSKTVKGLFNAEPVKVFEPGKGKPYSEQIWAPELHILDGKCYIYVACDDGDNKNHRTYVLYNDSSDPQAPYQMGGRMTDSTDKWAIDASIFHYKGQRYVTWSGWEGDENIRQNIYVAKMSDPFTISSERVLVSTPEYEWEKLGAPAEPDSPHVNEGPFALVKGDKLYIVYSASVCWGNNYALGMVELCGDDPLKAEDWKKRPEPVFKSTEKVKGPGHAAFALNTPDGDLMFYHAFEKDCSFGCGSCLAIAQKFTWNGDEPVFGAPESEDGTL